MSEPYKVAVLVGSLRRDSFNRKMARNLIALAPPSLKLEIVEIGDLPLYNQDLEEDAARPAAWTEFRRALRARDAVLFVTPEYNRSVPAAMKNALDVGSRPYSENVFSGKPGAVMSVTTGGLGAFGANHHLRQSLTALNVPVLQQPEAYISRAAELFDDEGRLKNESTQKLVEKFLHAYAGWVAGILNQGK